MISMNERALGELTERAETWNPAAASTDEPFIYVDIASIDNIEKRINGAAQVTPRNAPSRARQRLRAGDILVSTVRPNLNAVALVPDELDGAIASTGFCVLRPIHRQLDSRYLYHWVQTRSFVGYLVSRMTGANYPAVSDSVVRSAQIPDPGIAEQRRIAVILDKADTIRRKRRQTLLEIDTFLRATFLDMFGDPVRNPKALKEEPLGDIGELERGRSQHRPRNDPRLLGGPYPFIQTGDVARANGIIKTYFRTYSELGLSQSRMWPAGTLCITIAANIAETAMLGFDACFPDSVVGFVSNKKTNSEFVQYWMTFLKKVIQAKAPRVAQSNINLEILRQLPVIVPDRDLQDKFAALVQRARKSQEVQESAQREANMLLFSLSQRAFQGRLPCD